MDAVIIAVGSEMLTPERVDTNSLFLTDQLNSIGVEVVAKHVLGDDRERLATAVTQAQATSQLLILSGGLGPTEDDVTRDAVAMALGRPQVFNADIGQAIEERFRRMNRIMPQINKRQAMVIEGAELLSNDRGTAPGQWIDVAGKVIVILPGPPHELKSMFDRECLPRMRSLVPPMVIRTQIFRITGMSESDLDQTISPIYKKFQNPATTVLAHNGDLQVRLRARCSTEQQATELLAGITQQIDDVLGDRIYSHNADPLEVVIGRKLSQAGQTIVVAESATGGGLADRISSIPGSSAYFVGGFITYTNEMKTLLLGVPPGILSHHGAVSAETAGSMATGARDRTGATWALSVTGNAGPGADAPGEDGKQEPVGTIFIGLAGPDHVEVVRRVWPVSDRARVRAFSVQTALDMMNRKLP